MYCKCRFKIGFIFSICLCYFICIPSVSYSLADELNPGLYSPNSSQFNTSYKDWTAKWWQWFIKIPNSQHPFGDETGKNCNVDQSGPVWFLVGSAGTVERDCTIPSNVAILFPVVNTECSYSETPSLKSEEDLRSCAIDGNSGASLGASVDGREIKSIDKYRVTSDVFPVVYPNDPVFPTVSNVSQAVSDGWFIFLEPLKPGLHEIKFNTIQLNPRTVIDTTYHITVK